MRKSSYDATPLTLRGLNVQWPFSQLLARGLKTIEVRSYPVAKCTVKFAAGEEVWLVETVGQTNHGATPLDTVDLDSRPSSARIVAAVTFAESCEYTILADFHADRARHCIVEGGAKDWSDSKPRFGWRVAHVRRLLQPIPLPTKADGGRLHTQVGIHEPVTFTALFAPSEEVTAGAGPASHQSAAGAASAAADAPCADSSSRPWQAEEEWHDCAEPGEWHDCDDVNWEYFEEQRGAWCGMHAINNYLRGPYVTEDDCRWAARLVAADLLESAGGYVEDPMHTHRPRDRLAKHRRDQHSGSCEFQFACGRWALVHQ